MIPLANQKKRLDRPSSNRSRPNNRLRTLAVSRARARPAMVTKQQVRAMINSKINSAEETKYFDTILGATNIDSDGITPFSLTDIPQGSTDTTRDGDTAKPTLLFYSVHLRYNATSTITNLSASNNVARLLIFRWKPFFGDVAPTATKILTYSGTLTSAYGPLVHDGRNQFDVLVDEIVQLDGIANPQALLRGFVKCTNNIQWKAGSTTNQTNGLYVLLISDAVPASGVYVGLQDAIFRVDFTDA